MLISRCMSSLTVGLVLEAVTEVTPSCKIQEGYALRSCLGQLQTLGDSATCLCSLGSCPALSNRDLNCRVLAAPSFWDLQEDLAIPDSLSR